ncbi:hypothetical protein H8Z60_20970 [Mycolicibacterium fortuitum]|uniref:hypothetical protein n=1 Tax=Mycolicibacterium fortuitum TaxID=1766 RepID=UPI001CE15752|nr:hypothetical protein [Mycolicibacterium fortuitum]MCA4754998.1 hypothetical protein [Mycolicibacterium fortuitum]WAY17114.1 hypothetical protein OF855_17290 [Mycolicibacterium fortuitum]
MSLDPFGNYDPFAAPAPRQATPPPPQPAPPPPQPAPPPTAPAWTGVLHRATPEPPAPLPRTGPSTAPPWEAGGPPRTVLLAGYLVGGIATLLVVGAIGTLLALPELEFIYGGTTFAGVASAAVSVVVAGALVWLAVQYARRRGTARTPMLAGIGITAAVAVAIIAMAPGGQVSWFRTLTLILGAAALLLTIAIVVLILQPKSKSYFVTPPTTDQLAMLGLTPVAPAPSSTLPAEPDTVTTRPVAAPPPRQAPPPPPAPRQDYDPFQ